MNRLHAGMATVALIAFTLAGCAAEADAPPSPEPSAAEPAAIALSCDDLLPAETAAAALGFPVSELVPDGEYADAGGALGAVGLVMSNAAYSASGVLDCRWTAETPSGWSPTVRVMVLPDAADEFRLTQINAVGKLGELEAVAIGDDGYLVCNGEGLPCRIETLAGDNWLSVSLSPKYDDRSIITGLAAALVDRARSIAPVAKITAAVDCGSILSANALTVAGIQGAFLIGENFLDTQYSQFTAARRSAGFRDCYWSSAARGEGQMGLVAVPSALNPTPGFASGGGSSNLSLVEIPDVGDSALGACVGYSCELAVLSSGTWLLLFTVTAEADGLDKLIALAQEALANLSA